MERVRYRLPGGLVDAAGIVHRQVELKPLNGRDELFLAGRSGRESNGEVSALLSRCVRHIGTIRPVSTAVARSLLVADRQYLLLKLRETTFGEQILATIVCPGCGHKIDIDFRTQDIPVKESIEKGPLYQMSLPAEMGDTVVFRLPNGDDQEMIAPLLQQDEVEEAAVSLLGQCVRRIGDRENPGVAGMRQLPPPALTAIEQKMEALAPAVSLTMTGDCLECGRVFAVPFDLTRFFFSELRTNGGVLLQEVHFLAYHYHWSEREILGMPRGRRRKYIALLAKEMERLNDGI